MTTTRNSLHPGSSTAVRSKTQAQVQTQLKPSTFTHSEPWDLSRLSFSSGQEENQQTLPLGHCNSPLCTRPRVPAPLGIHATIPLEPSMAPITPTQGVAQSPAPHARFSPGALPRQPGLLWRCPPSTGFQLEGWPTPRAAWTGETLATGLGPSRSNSSSPTLMLSQLQSPPLEPSRHQLQGLL